MEKGHYGHYSGNSKHSRVTNHNMDATKRDDEKHHGAAKAGIADRNNNNKVDDWEQAISDKIQENKGAAQNGDITESPSKFTQVVRRFKYDQTGGYAMARNLAVTALSLAPVPFGKVKAAKNIAKAFSNAPKQYSNLAKGKESIGGFREFANPKLRNHFNPTNKRTTSLPNPIPNSTKAYNKLQYPMGKKVFSSKPVEFIGPNPANKIGAGGNSYPR